MATGQLSISRLVKGEINLGSVAAQTQDLSTLLILGTASVIDMQSRVREYQDLATVATDFGTSGVEYKTAALYFGQTPRPTTLLIGRWAKAPTSGQLIGGTLSASQQDMALWNGVTSPSFSVNLNGTNRSNVTPGTFAGAANLHGVAGLIQTALAAIVAGTTCIWNESFARFEITVGTNGAGSTIGFLGAGSSGTNISAMLGMSAAPAFISPGMAAESVTDALTVLDRDHGGSWYAVTVPEATVSEHLRIAEFVEASDTKHFYGVTSNDAGILNSTTADIAATLQGLAYNKTAVLYSGDTPGAVASMLGRILTTDYAGSKTTLTLMYKVMPGATPDRLNATQTTNANNKYANVYVNYKNGVSILQEGRVASGHYIDTIMGCDAMLVEIQNAIFNRLYTAKTKVPQTDAGVHQLVIEVERVLLRFVQNGLLAPGYWREEGFGTLEMDEFLDRGFYVYTAPLILQSNADRAARKAPKIQIAAKLAGAIHYSDFLINVNQ